MPFKYFQNRIMEDFSNIRLKQVPMNGKIKAVECKNFVTYKNVIFRPTDNLNVIIGPNGTGKSTLVSAIVLGLGGEPKLLCRATNISDYIKNGTENATITIEIYSNPDGETLCFTRTFNQNGKSEFSVNHEKTNKSFFLAQVANFKIDVNNLCQFLPQDRVQDFAKMNAQEIFKNIINSVCSPNEIALFTNLKELRQGQENENILIEKLTQNLQVSLKRKIESEKVLSRYHGRQTIVYKLAAFKVKKIWLELQTLEKMKKEHEMDLEQANKSLSNHEKSYSETVKKKDIIVGILAQIQKTADSQKSIERTSLLLKAKESILIESKKQTIRDARVKAEESKRDLSYKRNLLQYNTKMYQVLLQDFKNYEKKNSANGLFSEEDNNYKAKLEEMRLETSQIKKIRDEMNKMLENYLNEMQKTKMQIDRINNVDEQKLENLQARFPELYAAFQWLEKNKSVFSGKIYKPMIMELTVCDPHFKKYFENTIPIRDLTAFTCENKTDLSIFINELSIKQKLQVNAVYSPPSLECSYASMEPIANLKEFGFTSYLLDLVTGAPPILNYLCSQYNIHTIPIGSDTVGKYIDSIPSNIRLYFGGQQRYVVSYSKYSKEASLMQNHIKQKNFLYSHDLHGLQLQKERFNEVLEKTEELRNEKSIVEVKLRQLDFQYSQVMDKEKEYTIKKNQFKQLNSQLLFYKQNIKEILPSCVCVNLHDNFRSANSEPLRDIITQQKKKIGPISSYVQANAKRKMLVNRINAYKQQNNDIEEELNEKINMKLNLEKIVKKINETLENTTRKYSLKQGQFRELYHNLKGDNISFTDFCESTPNTLEEITDIIMDLSARIDCLEDIDQNIINTHKQKCKEIETIRINLEEKKIREQSLRSTIVQKYAEFNPTVCRIVKTISTKFEQFMAIIGYVGEVLLEKKTDYDFNLYGLKIMIKYRRDAVLQSLDRHSQSGGERAVAIAVFSLSLQHITHVPFRCVDEINQGMDATNERKIFKILVSETTQPGRAQYFFVTPKLISNLKCNDRMSVHIVFNGKFIQPV